MPLGERKESLEDSITDPGIPTNEELLEEEVDVALKQPSRDVSKGLGGGRNMNDILKNLQNLPEPSKAPASIPEENLKEEALDQIERKNISPEEMEFLDNLRNIEKESPKLADAADEYDEPIYGEEVDFEDVPRSEDFKEVDMSDEEEKGKQQIAADTFRDHLKYPKLRDRINKRMS